MRSSRKLTLTAMFVAIGTVSSHLIFIPIGITKVFPIQHFINVMSAVILGPFYAVAQAFLVSLLRNMLGTGSIFAFPGSIFGALLAGFLYSKTKKLGFAYVGEVIGTGILGGMACYPLATLLLGEQMALFGMVPAFIVSSFFGATIGIILLVILLRNNSFKRSVEEFDKVRKIQ